MPREVKQGHLYLLLGPNVKMLTGMIWKEVLHNGKNKEGLFDIIASYLQSIDGYTSNKVKKTSMTLPPDPNSLLHALK